MPILTLVRAFRSNASFLGISTVNDNQRRSPMIFRSPVFWGGLAYVGFHALWANGVITNPFILRYFAQHPVEYVETAMFLVGIAALVLKAMEVRAQKKVSTGAVLPKRTTDGVSATEASSLLRLLERLPSWRQRHVYVGRLRKGLLHVQRAGSAEKLDDELKYLADEDADRAHGSYGLVRMVIWAIPILGFLGTVIGIALAMGKLSPQALDTSLPEVMSNLTIAFDTTALALALSIVLFFGQFSVDRYEQGLLERVNEQTAEELLGRFERIPDTPDGQLAAVRKSLQAILESHEQNVIHQIDTWQTSLRAVTDQWRGIQDSLHESSVSANAMQQGMARQADTLNRVVEAAGNIATMETQLNRNLSALAGAKNFEQTVMSLAAAIHLLNARLGDDPGAAAPVTLQPQKRKGQAA
jgi:biopolymer transport protein ExbB/TolQ